MPVYPGAQRSHFFISACCWFELCENIWLRMNTDWGGGGRLPELGRKNELPHERSGGFLLGKTRPNRPEAPGRDRPEGQVSCFFGFLFRGTGGRGRNELPGGREAASLGRRRVTDSAIFPDLISGRRRLGCTEMGWVARGLRNESL